MRFPGGGGDAGLCGGGCRRLGLRGCGVLLMFLSREKEKERSGQYQIYILCILPK